MRRALFGCVVTGLLLVGSLTAQQRKQSEIDLQSAIRTETIDGDVNAAIARYKKLADQYGTNDRSVAASALLHLAECYQKIGDRQARTVYEQLVRDYADQKEAVSAARARLATSPAKATAPLTRQVWKSSAESTSIDGRYASYVGGGDVYVRDFIQQKDVRLTDRADNTRPAQYAENSAISRDGMQVAYSWSIGPRYQLRLVSANGRPSQTPRSLVDNLDITFIVPLDWSPDGQRIAVRIGRADRTGQLALVSAKDGTLQVLKSIDWRGPIKAAFSPDGASLAYDLVADDKTSARDIFVISTGGTAEHRVVEHPANDLLAGWSADGRSLLFVSDRSGTAALWSLAIADGRPSGPAALLRSNLGQFTSTIGVTSANALIYVQKTAAAKVYIALVDFSTGRILAAPEPALETYLQGQRGPVWSWDGKQIAWSTRMGTGRGSLGAAVQSLSTGEVTEVAPQLSAGVLRTWAPDGSLTYHGQDLKGQPGIFRVDPRDGRTSPIALSTDGFLSLPSWSADGRYLVYRSQTATPTLVLRDSTTGSSRDLIQGRPFAYFTISPDGKQVAYAEPLQSPRALRMVAVDTGLVRDLLTVSDGETISSFLWLPESQRLVVWTARSGKPIGSVVPIGGGAAVVLDAAIPEDFRPSPDGRRIAFTSGDSVLEVWTLENFLPPARH